MVITDITKGDKMKFNIYAIMLAGILGTTPLCYAKTTTEQTSVAEVKKETKDLIKTLKSYTIEQKDEAIKKTKTALNNLDKRMDALEARVDENWDEMDEKSRKKARESLKTLRKQRNKVAQWYGGMKGSTASAWEHMKEGFSKAYKSINTAWEKSENEFDQEK